MYCDVQPSFYSHAEVRARKPHRCVECAAPIDKSELHFRYTGKWDGDISSGRQHLLCMEACMLVRDRFNDGECIPFGELLEWWSECGPDYPAQRLKYRADDATYTRLRSLLARIKLRARPFRKRRRRTPPAA